jgi:hypothetical protein
MSYSVLKYDQSNMYKLVNRMELDNNAHSVVLLWYHLVLTVKYRRKVIDDAISGRAKEIFEYISPKCIQLVCGFYFCK